MAKTKVKIYDPKKEEEKERAKLSLKIILEIVIDLILYALILMFAGEIFKGMYIENFAYAFLAASILSILNVTIKPILTYFMLPITIVSFGLLYPLTNVIVLKICGLLLEPHLIVEGFLGPFFLVILVSFLKIIADQSVEKIIERSFE